MLKREKCTKRLGCTFLFLNRELQLNSRRLGMEKILSYGAILWDVFENEKYLGGAPLNLAAHLGRLGQEAYIYSAVGEDGYGDEAVKLIKEIGVRTDYIQHDDTHPTGYAKVILNENKAAQYEFCENGTDRFITVTKEICEQITKERFGVFCYGTYCQQGAVSRATLKEIVNRCQFDIIFCDINIRDYECELSMLTDSLSYCDVLKLNDEEVEFLAQRIYGSKQSEREVVELLQDDYNIKIVCVTKGAKGCSIYTGKEAAVDVCGEVVEAIDTLGAGDAFSAGFLYGLLQGESLSRCGELGNILGGYVASQRGGIPKYSERITKQMR